MRRAVAQKGVVVAIVLAAAAVSRPAEAQKIDTIEVRTTPVPHLYMHGRLGDAEFQVVLPEDWNGKLLIGARGFSGDEFAAGAFLTVGLEKGYAYALSDQGWNRFTIIDSPEDKYFESRRRIVQLAHVVTSIVRRHYGDAPERTYMIGGSNGGHNTKWLVEDYPNLFDGGIAGYGITSYLEWMAGMARFVRNFDIIAARIADIVAARTADPDWDPATEPLSPPLTAAQLQALLDIYNMPAELAGGLTFNNGRPPGSEYRWAETYAALIGYLTTSLAKFDRFYDPNGDGELSLDEIKAWDPDIHSPVQVFNDLHRVENSGDLERPILIMHGVDDPIVSVGETEAYQRLVESVLGEEAARELLAVYYIPGMGYGGAEYNAMIWAMLDTLDAWVDYLESGGAEGSLPPDMLGPYPRS